MYAIQYGKLVEARRPYLRRVLVLTHRRPGKGMRRSVIGIADLKDAQAVEALREQAATCAADSVAPHPYFSHRTPRGNYRLAVCTWCEDVNDEHYGGHTASGWRNVASKSRLIDLYHTWYSIPF